jgi:hypothetical protein
MLVDLTQEERYYVGEWLSNRIEYESLEMEEEKMVRELFDKLKLSCFMGEN